MESFVGEADVAITHKRAQGVEVKAHGLTFNRGVGKAGVDDLDFAWTDQVCDGG